MEEGVSEDRMSFLVELHNLDEELVSAIKSSLGHEIVLNKFQVPETWSFDQLRLMKITSASNSLALCC